MKEFPAGPCSFPSRDSLVHAPAFAGFGDAGLCRRIRALAFAGVFLLSVFLLGWSVGDRGIWSSHEAIAGRIARAMVRSGDYTVERFETGRSYNNEKPPLYYWAVSLFSKIVGEVNSLSIRLPSTVSAVLLVALVFWVGTLGFSLDVGVMASLILMTSIHYRWLASVGRIDMVLALLVVSSGFALYSACRSNHTVRSWILYSIAYVFMGLSVLAKGPVGIVLVFCGIGPFLLLRKKWEEILSIGLSWMMGAMVLAMLCLGREGWFLLVPVSGLILWSFLHKPTARFVWTPHLIGVGLLLLVAAPWFFLVHRETQGQFTRDFFIYHNLVRFLPRGVAGYEALKHRPLWFYVPHLFTSLLPWSLLLFALPRKILAGDKDRGSYDLRRFLVLWSSTSFVFLSLSSFKRADYLLPILPLLSLQLAWLLSRFYEEEAGKGVRSALMWTAGALAVAVAGLWCVALSTAFGDRLDSVAQSLTQSPKFISRLNSDDVNGLLTYLKFLREPDNRVSILIFSFLMSAGIAGIFRRRRSLKWVFSLMVGMAMVFHVTHDMKIAPFFEPLRTQRPMAMQINSIAGKEDEVVLVETEPHDLVFYLDREVKWFPDVYPGKDLNQVLAQERGKSLYFILDRKKYLRMKKTAPLDADVVAESIPDHFDGMVVVKPKKADMSNPSVPSE